MGGSSEVDSEVGRGSLVRLSLPVTDDRGDAPVPSQPGRDADVLAGRRILVVEDEADLRNLVGRVLGRCGCEIETAGDGLEAETVLRSDPERFDAVILDMVMPRRDGLATFAVLRNLAPGLPVLLCSGYDATHRGATILTKPRTAFLAKPYSRFDLVDALAGLLEPRIDSVDTT